MRIRDKVKPTVPPLPGGNYLGICVYSIDLGEQLSEFEGKSKGYYNKVMLGFEICGQSVTVDGKEAPRVLSKTFSAAKGKRSGLRLFLGAWEAKELSDDEYLDKNTVDYVGLPAFLSVTLNETGEYSNITGIAPLPSGFPIQVPAPRSELIRFEIDPWDQAAFEKLPDWAQEKVKASTDYQKLHAPKASVTAAGIDYKGLLNTYGQQPALQNQAAFGTGVPTDPVTQANGASIPQATADSVPPWERNGGRQA